MKDDRAASLAALAPALLRLDLRLRFAVETNRGELAERARDPLRGLYISEAEVDALLADARVEDIDLPPAAASPRLAQLTALFELDDFEQDVILVCVAPDIDVRYERLYAYMQDNVTRQRPTVDLLLRLLTASLEERTEARAAFAPSSKLLARGLLVVADDSAATNQASLLSRPMRVEERVVEYILGSDVLDPRVEAFGQIFMPAIEAHPWQLPADIRDGLIAALTDDAAGGSPVIYLHGASTAGKGASARAACAAAGRPLLLVDVPALMSATPDRSLGTVFAAVAREAVLQQAVLGMHGFDRLLGDDSESATARVQLRRVLRMHSTPVLLLGESRWEPSMWLPGANAMRLELRPLSVEDRVQLWRSQLNGRLAKDDVADLATRFRLTERDAIEAVAADAASRALLRGSKITDLQDFELAARTIATPPLDGLARHIEPRYGWDDIVLPPDGLAQLREICARLRHRGTVLERWGYGRKHARREGITALFAGQPGTGKTMAAEIIAGELGLDLYRIDLSAVVSKYIGETEKNLEKIFQAADQGEAVLLFDEADAIFGKRSEVRDARDRYANVEVAYLLQRLEAYDGLAVLTTNLSGNIDEAFIRRLDCVLEFPLPGEAERLRIWRLGLPPQAPLAKDVDLPFLARKFKLAGGHIRNITLTAAFLAAEDHAPISMRHLARGTRREYQKLGKLVDESDFERYFALLKD